MCSSAAPEANPGKLHDAMRVGSVALLVFMGAFLGSSVVGSLRFGGDGPAILFPPYAVLTAALLLSPPRWWWVYLLACSAGSFRPHLAISPIGLVVTAELANYIKAIVAAASVRMLVGVPRDLASRREMGWLLVGAVGLGPIAGAFVGAWASTRFGGGNSYWDAWGGWSVSNAATGVTLLPAILAAVDVVQNRRRWPSARRLAEAGICAAAMFAVGFYIFSTGSRTESVLPSRLCWLLPFGLWAAVRFGPAGTGLALSGVTALAAWSTSEGHGPFASAPRAEVVQELQFFLITSAIPLLLLTALLAQQRSTAAALRRSESDARQRAAQLASIYRTAPVGLAFIDTELRYVDISNELARQNGMPADGHLGRTLRDVLPPYMIDAVEANYREVLSTGSPLTDVQMGTPDDAQHWVVDYHPVNNADGQLLGVHTVVQDITEQRRAEEVLRVSNQKAQDLAGRLIHAQEAERSRIARELHDDVHQQLAAISLALSALRRSAR